MEDMRFFGGLRRLDCDEVCEINGSKVVREERKVGDEVLWTC